VCAASTITQRNRGEPQRQMPRLLCPADSRTQGTSPA